MPGKIRVGDSPTKKADGPWSVLLEKEKMREKQSGKEKDGKKYSRQGEWPPQ